MKRIAIALLLTLVAVGAQAETIFDLQTGLVPEDTIVSVFGVTVTAAAYNGVFVAEAPFAGYNGIWVYTGGDLGYVPGDILDIEGAMYVEYNGLSELNATAAEVVISMTGAGPVPAPNAMTAAELNADPEIWESCMITVTDGMMVTEILSYGEWIATAESGEIVTFDDTWYDDTTVALDDCYNSATGILYYSFGVFKLEAFVDGIELTDCTVDAEDHSFGTVKALYR